ncbi:MAG: cell division protease FtsH [Miltoncostaeaceae bacterium]|nr:cell division protease FtsH [Miltoncostaeaceae bacterium]
MNDAHAHLHDARPHGRLGAPAVKARERLVAWWERTRLLPKVTKILLGLLVVLVAALAVGLLMLRPSPAGREISLTELTSLAGQGRVAEATLLDQDHVVEGRLTAGGSSSPGGPYFVSYPSNEGTTARILAALDEAGVAARVDAQTAKANTRFLLLAILPILLLANLFALFFAGRGQSGLGEVEAFGRMDREGQIGGRVTFADVAGVEEAQEELMEVVDYLRDPAKYASLGAMPPKGVLLFGPPGCGKTLLARAVAGEARVPFFSVSGAEFVESLVGVGAARVRDLFKTVRSVAPAIVFIDELDAAGRRRGTGGGGGSEERDQTLNQLLVEMDGFQIAEGLVVMAATNRPDILDPALLRPGRFDRHITIERPDVERRQAILRLHAARRPLAEDVDFAELARATPGFTGADLANVLNEGALLAIRGGKDLVDRRLLSEAVQRVLSGPQRRGHLFTDEERRRVATHEAGHAIAAALLGDRDHVHRVSIVARGRGVGTTSLERADADAISTEAQLRTRLAVAMAGRAAEEHVLGNASTGSADDLELATRIAREMAGVHGLTPEVGLTAVLARDKGALGNPPELDALSDETHAAFDQAVSRLLDEGHAAARHLIAKASPHLHDLTERLLADEQLEGRALAEMLPEAMSVTEAERLLAGKPRTRA